MPTNHSFSLTTQESLDFAQLSGDFNPLHLDPILARRLKYGGTVLHGMHLCLQLLARFLNAEQIPRALTRIEVQFYSPLRENQEITVTTKQMSAHQHKWSVKQQGERVATLKAEWSLSPIAPPSFTVSATLPTPRCRERTFTELQTATGSLPLGLDPTHLRHTLIGLNHLPLTQVAILCAATRLVGMEAPGLHSLFSGFDLTFHPPLADTKAELAYQVIEWDPRFARIVIAIQGCGVTGTLETFFRPNFATQQSFRAIQAITPNAMLCSGQRALIIGGSRGLGEVMAKLIAAAGGETIITYHTGQNEAQRVADQIRAGGGICSTRSWDVLSPDATHFSTADNPITHLYYFASPRIELNLWGEWRESLFQHYLHYYVTGFHKSLQALLSTRAKTALPLEVFYPSTSFLDQPEPGALEYAMAKSAGETLCHYLSTQEQTVHCFTPRLIRLRTDQTIEADNGTMPDPVTELQPLLNTFIHP